MHHSPHGATAPVQTCVMGAVKDQAYRWWFPDSLSYRFSSMISRFAIGAGMAPQRETGNHGRSGLRAMGNEVLKLESPHFGSQMAHQTPVRRVRGPTLECSCRFTGSLG